MLVGRDWVCSSINRAILSLFLVIRLSYISPGASQYMFLVLWEKHMAPSVLALVVTLLAFEALLIVSEARLANTQFATHRSRYLLRELSYNTKQLQHHSSIRAGPYRVPPEGPDGLHHIWNYEHLAGVFFLGKLSTAARSISSGLGVWDSLCMIMLG